MARLIGKRPQLHHLAFLWEFIMHELPDYIYAVFSPEFETGAGRVMECDVMLLIPHMGCFVIDVVGGKRFSSKEIEGAISLTGRDQADKLRDNAWTIRRALRDKFNLWPLVYEIQCFPFYETDQRFMDALPPSFDPNHILGYRDFENEYTFLRKLYQWKLEAYRSAGEEVFFDDLTDDLAYTIFRSWATGIPAPERPPRPPMVFLSYSTRNQMRAGEIKKALEKRGIFVWRAPEDIDIGEYWYPVVMEAIRQSDVFVLLVSKPAQESPEVRKEFNAAEELGKPIMPLVIEECDITAEYAKLLSKHQYRFMTEDDEQIYRELEAAIRRMANPTG